MKNFVIKRVGRYALIYRGKEYTCRYVVACGYNGKSGEWNQGYYFVKRANAVNEFDSLSGKYCAKCRYVNDGCIICKR